MPLRTFTRWLFGSGGTKILDEAIYTKEEKVADDQRDLEGARAFAGPSGDPGLVNQLVDGANRLVRPGVTLWLVGGFIGWWRLPAADLIDPFWQNLFMLVITFWFGGRALLKDLPAAVRLMRGR